MDNRKQVVILIGLKGSGKTYIGSLMQQRLGIYFFRVEDVWLSVKADRFSSAYIQEGTDKVNREIDRILCKEDMVTIESTGIAHFFNPFYKHLKSKYNVRLVKINVSPEKCLTRVKSRDQTLHIPVSDDMLTYINEEASKVDMQFDLIIDNELMTDDEILDQIKKVL